MLLKVEYEKPIDTTEDLVKSGLDIWLSAGTWHKEYFITAANEWRVKAFEQAEINVDWDDDTMLVAKHGKSCSPSAKFGYYDRVHTNPNYKNLPDVHFSRESIKPYFAAWAVQKTSLWKEAINKHILLYHQV